MIQGSLIGLYLICRNRSFISGIQQIATKLCQKIPHKGDSQSLANTDRITATKIKPFLGVKN